jgi:hypothetical protein
VWECEIYAVKSLSLLISREKEGALFIASTMTITLASPTLHDFDFFTKWHPQTLRRCVFQKFTSGLILRFVRNDIFRTGFLFHRPKQNKKQ